MRPLVYKREQSHRLPHNTHHSLIVTMTLNTGTRGKDHQILYMLIHNIQLFIIFGRDENECLNNTAFGPAAK